MTLDAIRKNILKEAEDKASEIGSEATKESERIEKEASDKAKDIIKNAEHEAQKESERLRKENDAGVEMEANAMLLEARSEVVERSLRRVLSLVGSELSRNSMKRILELGMKQFSETVGEGQVKVKTSKKNAELLKGVTDDVEFEDIDGFMLYNKDGKVALNATIGNIVENQADAARRIIAGEIFGNGKVEMKRERKPAKARKASTKKKR